MAEMKMIDTSNLFPSLPSEADCWIYAADRELSADDEAMLRQLLDQFLNDWSSHGRVVHGAFSIEERRIIMLAAWIEGGDISGCGIDKSLHLIEEVARTRSFAWTSALNILFRDAEGQIALENRGGFKRLAEENAVSELTPVFDTSIRNLGELRSKGVERLARDSWHAEVFPLHTEPAAAQ